MMRVAIMQPYFMPYLGYFQLVANSDVFVLHDDVKYTKKGWINRNRFLANSEAQGFSIPLRKGSDFLTITERVVSDDFLPDGLFRKFRGAYVKAPFWDETCELLNLVFSCDERELSGYVANSVRATAGWLGLDTRIIRSSEMRIDPLLRGQDRVLRICNELSATEYVNLAGGMSLYSFEAFKHDGIQLEFLKSELTPYLQLSEHFVPALSVIDTLMWLGQEEVKQLVRHDFNIIGEMQDAAFSRNSILRAISD